MFPLIGSETFNYPFILNNLDWETNKDRQGIFLGLKDKGDMQDLIEKNNNIMLKINEFAIEFI